MDRYDLEHRKDMRRRPPRNSDDAAPIFALSFILLIAALGWLSLTQARPHPCANIPATECAAALQEAAL